jgi:hypothetical protein
MNVIGHEAVRSYVVPPTLGCAQDLRSDDVHGFVLREYLGSLIRAKREEIRVLTGVGQVWTVGWIRMRHAARRAG